MAPCSNSNGARVLAKKTDPHSIMVANLRRLVKQAEDADRSGDIALADGLWRASQSHARQISPFDPAAAVPVLESVMCRFSALAEAASDPRLANGYHRLSQSAAHDLAPLKLSRTRSDTDAVEDDPEDVKCRLEERRARIDALMREAETVPPKQRWAIWDKVFAMFDSRSLQRG
jgi:hypothetical protein